MPCPNCDGFDIEMTENQHGHGHTCECCGYHEER